MVSILSAKFWFLEIFQKPPGGLYITHQAAHTKMCVFGFPDEPPGGEALYRQAMQFCNFFLGLKDDFPNEPWFVDIVNYLVVSVISPSFSEFERTKLKSETKYYIWEDPILWRMGSDQVIMRCVPDIEIPYVLELCHSSPFGGHYGTQRTSRKVKLFKKAFWKFPLDIKIVSYLDVKVHFSSSWKEEESWIQA